MSGARNSTQRFSDRVEDYVRYRPGYPREVVTTLECEARLQKGDVIADVGSGTGISASLFLEAGYEVYAIEPNPAMRGAADRLLRDHPGYHSVDGTAESTSLPDASVDLAIAAQAFHWFNPTGARAEFRRILKPGGFAALLWNSRQTDTTPFLREYEALLQTHGTDYRQVAHTNITAEQLEDFFGTGYRRLTFPNEQALDYPGLQGRLLSSSYTPAAGDLRREPMLAELRRIFEEHQQDGQVSILYQTELFVGRVGPPT